jgi:hypothetical protein
MQQTFHDQPQLLCVAPHLVEQFWPHVVPLIERALRKSESDLTTDHIKAKIDSGKSLLWIIWDVALLGSGTTEIQKLENGRKVCVITTCAGRNHGIWEHVLNDIERYAKQEGCDAVRFYGRSGWIRRLKWRGYTQPWIVCEKRI